jgi:hypothetical protein
LSAPSGFLGNSSKGAVVKLVLIVSDTCVEPSITNSATEIRVTIGTSHDFDDILDVAGGILSNEQMTHIHRLWADDTFPRNFIRVGDDLIITARE